MLRQSWRAIALTGVTIAVVLGSSDMWAKRDMTQADPSDFTADELQLLQRRFGVHGPQPPLAQLFTSGVDQLQPLRAQTRTG